MRNFFARLADSFARFMYGRNGTDQLNIALCAVYMVLWLLCSIILAFVDSQIVNTVLSFLTSAILVAVILRTFSKNLDKRQAENQKFLAWWYPVKNRLTGAKARRQDKDHKYFTCKSCKTICRVPAGKGRIVITCPKCGAKIEGKS